MKNFEISLECLDSRWIHCTHTTCLVGVLLLHWLARERAVTYLSDDERPLPSSHNRSRPPRPQLFTYKTPCSPSTRTTRTPTSCKKTDSTLTSIIMSVQDRAQAQLSQLDKEVSALASAHGTIVKIR
jgi:hypothetical protein